MIQVFTFYLFATFVIASGVMTIASRNPVHSVLWLILAFFNAAGLFLLIGAEFLAFLLVIVYVGAVAVLAQANLLAVGVQLNMLDFAALPITIGIGIKCNCICDEIRIRIAIR